MIRTPVGECNNSSSDVEHGLPYVVLCLADLWCKAYRTSPLLGGVWYGKCRDLRQKSVVGFSSVVAHSLEDNASAVVSKVNITLVLFRQRIGEINCTICVISATLPGCCMTHNVDSSVRIQPHGLSFSVHTTGHFGRAPLFTSHTGSYHIGHTSQDDRLDHRGSNGYPLRVLWWMLVCSKRQFLCR